jgi:hypothetical protein
MIKNPLYENPDPLSFFLGDADTDTRSEAGENTGQEIPTCLKKKYRWRSGWLLAPSSLTIDRNAHRFAKFHGRYSVTRHMCPYNMDDSSCVRNNTQSLAKHQPFHIYIGISRFM